MQPLATGTVSGGRELLAVMTVPVAGTGYAVRGGDVSPGGDSRRAGDGWSTSDSWRGVDEFVRARGASLFRYAMLLTGSEHEAADLLQDALIRAGLHWSKVRAADNPDAYVRAIVTRTHLNSLRRWRREHSVAVLPESVATPEMPLVDGDGAVWQALSELAPRQRAVVVLRFYEQLTEREIADVLGIAVGTVKSQLSRALATLRSRLDRTREGAGDA